MISIPSEKILPINGLGITDTYLASLLSFIVLVV